MKSLPVKSKKGIQLSTPSSLGKARGAVSSRVQLSSVPQKSVSGLQRVVSPYIKKGKRYTKLGIRSALLSPMFHTTCKVAMIALFVVGTLYTSFHVIGKTFANEVVVSQSEIIARVSKLTTVPQEVPHEIVRVQDAEALRKQNPFYQDIKEGDYILMYTGMAVIYDLRTNTVVAVKRNEVSVPKF